jgi:hypothetical protein
LISNEKGLGVRVRIFNATFNNISDISWLSVLLVEEARVPSGKITYLASQWQTYYIKLHRVHLAMNGVSGNRH